MSEVGGESFSALFEAHQAFVQRVLRRYGVADGDLADACQDVFVVVHRKLDEFEGRAAFRTWLYAISRRTAFGYHRRGFCHREQAWAPERETADGAASQFEALARKRAALVLESALESLSVSKREVYVLHDLEERAMPEVAQMLGCPVQTAYARLYAARRELHGSLRRAGWALGLAAVALPTATARAAWASSSSGALGVMGVAAVAAVWLGIAGTVPEAATLITSEQTSAPRARLAEFVVLGAAVAPADLPAPAPVVPRVQPSRVEREAPDSPVAVEAPEPALASTVVFAPGWEIEKDVHRETQDQAAPNESTTFMKIDQETLAWLSARVARAHAHRTGRSLPPPPIDKPRMVWPRARVWEASIFETQ